MRGYLRHRAELRNYGLHGVQYVDGSFIDKMTREPRDIDVITFFVPPPEFNAAKAKAERPDVFDRHLSKHAFHCDALFVNLTLDPFETLDITRFWYGLFSHNREDEWRGLLHVTLAADEDAAGIQMLDSMESAATGES